VTNPRPANIKFTSLSIAGLLALFIIGIVIVSGRPRTSAPTSLPSASPHHFRRPVTWVLAQSSLSNLLSADPTIATRIFDHPYVYVTATPGSSDPVPPGWRSMPTVNFKSYAAFAAAVSAGTMPSWTKAVLYDPEAWSQTPFIEQTNVGYYMQQFSRLAHSHGWRVIMMPGTDLMNIYHKLPGETNPQAFIRHNIAGAAARYADVSEAQSQTIETNPGAYNWFLTRARSQALAANPHVVFLGGLTANILGTTASADVMYYAALSVTSVVDGFFLNVSKNAPDPVNAAQFLQQLAAYRQPAGGGAFPDPIVLSKAGETTQITPAGSVLFDGCPPSRRCARHRQARSQFRSGR
jgi:hypothetical protein